MLIGESDLTLIGDYTPAELREPSLTKAAVAIILRDGVNGSEFLLMQRAHHENDPWSGQMAFPGGKIDATDDSAKQAAMREAYEEVGVRLAESDYIGRLDDVYSFKVDGIYAVHVASFVFKVDRQLELNANYEVADMLWLPISYLNDFQNAHDFYIDEDPALRMPAIMIDESKNQILWGLTLRLLSILMDLLDKPMDALSQLEREHLHDVQNRNANRRHTHKFNALSMDHCVQ